MGIVNIFTLSLVNLLQRELVNTFLVDVLILRRMQNLKTKKEIEKLRDNFMIGVENAFTPEERAVKSHITDVLNWVLDIVPEPEVE